MSASASKNLPSSGEAESDRPEESGPNSRSDLRLSVVWERYPALMLAIAIIAGGKLTLYFAPAARDAQSWSGLAWAVCCVCVVMAVWFAARRQRTLLACTTLVGCFFFGVVCGGAAIPPATDALAQVATRKSEPIAIRAVIQNAAVWRPNPNHREMDPTSEPWRTQWQILCEQLRDGETWQPVHVHTQLSVDGRIDRFLPGDVVEVYGSYRSIYPPTNPGAFDLAAHNQRDARFVFVSADSDAQVALLDSTWRRPLSRVRALAVRGVDRALHRWITHGHAALAAALVFGQRQQVDWEDQQQLMATGTLHMLAISGMHVEIVASGVLLLCWLFGLADRSRLLLLVSVCVLYAGLADGKPPVMRAAVLVTALEVSRYFGRRARLANLLSFAAVFLFLTRASNVDEVGVHLSFLAVAAIGIFVLDPNFKDETQASAMQKLVRESSGRFGRVFQLVMNWLIGMLRLSFWVWLITCPLVWYHFHIVAPVAVPLNIVVAMPLSVALLAGLVTGLLSFVSPIGAMAGFAAGASLELIERLIDVGEALPLGHFWLPSPPLWWTVVFYSFAVAWLLYFRRRRRGALAIALCSWLVVGVIGVQAGSLSTFGMFANKDSAEAEQLRVTFLDVGHGTSVIIEMPNRKVWLYDAGHLGSPERSHQEIADALWALPTAEIDTLVLSHADSDHYNAALGLHDRFRIGRVASTSRFWASQDRALARLHQTITDSGLEQETWAAGKAGNEGEVRWQVLHPRSPDRSESDNSSSLCLLLEFQGKRILLPGDLDGTGLLNLVNMPDRPCHVLMAPHHGSLTHDPQALLDWCRPELVVVSGNHRAARSRVIAKYASATELLGVTFRDGAIQYRVNRDGTTSTWHWVRDQWQGLENVATRDY